MQIPIQNSIKDRILDFAKRREVIATFNIFAQH